MRIVTSMSPRGLQTYGQSFIASFKKHVSGVKLIVYLHDTDTLPTSTPEIEYRSLNAIPEHEQFYANFGTLKGGEPYNFRFDVVKFTHKVFAIADEAFKERSGSLVWLDADILFHQDMTAETFAKWTDGDICHLDRSVVPYPETSFIHFNLDNPLVMAFVSDFVSTFLSGEFRGFAEWHDGFIFGRLVNIYARKGIKVVNISRNDVLDAFMNSELADYMTHLKGPGKDFNPQDGGPKRYAQLNDVITFFKPKRLVETGTWNGQRALQMAEAAFQNSDEVEYIGFDLFEEASDDSDSKEMNTKAHTPGEQVHKLLLEYSQWKAQNGKTFRYWLFRGDTNKTLWDEEAQQLIATADFAYIDGGHSVETVRNDYKALEHVPVVVFDDFFSEDALGQIPPEDHRGTNVIFTGIDEKKNTKVILPSMDPVKGGGITSFALRVKGRKKKLPQVGMKMPLRIIPHDSVSKEYIRNNAEENLLLVDRWLEMGRPPTKKVHIVSAGPSLESYQKELATAKAHGDIIVCVKHSYPRLLDMGIVPDFCVVLDPRPIDGKSTHGVLRKDLFQTINPQTTFLVASMTDPSVTRYLQDRGARIVGWHAVNSAISGLNLGQRSFMIDGGTCAAMRSFSLFYTMGYRDFVLVAFDSSFEKKPTKKKEPKHLMAVELNGKKFYTTGELAAQLQDIQMLLNSQRRDYNLTMMSGGAAGEIWQAHKSRFLPYPIYSNLP